MNDIAISLQRLLSETIEGYNSNSPLNRQLNSLELVELITKIESHFSIRIHPVEFDEENFQTFENLVALVSRKLPA